ncbi:lysophospholipid acyltransferase family protein [Vulgatibacter incomptus]|uniref:1-acyl-sn-glycerol-3-phosphate acyltransferase n=1 Tax=Vulgatibacter incomptus TaxID=1391653 RepID=A0A0K1PFF2_9BACT|nr:lysophospholipid acyltransferase family protein [Vulgatibacter incomptus]AKU91844.1 1-acyl-sn-glycerol-3-phosphate acyltransferase [Vulgatibacter incomptus]
MSHLLRNTLAYATIASATVGFGALSTALSVLSLGRNHGTKAVAKAWGHTVLAASGVRYVVRGLDRFDHDRQFIIASNHQSLLDPPIVLCAAPQKVRFVAKRSLFHIPIFGQAIWAAGNVPIDRRRSEDATRRLEELGRRVGKDLSILFFPEGTRSVDGSLLPFKRGATMMALQTGLALLPVAVAGTAALLPKGARSLKPGVVGVAFGEPIEVAGCDLPDREALTNELRTSVERLMAEAEEARVGA